MTRVAVAAPNAAAAAAGARVAAGGGGAVDAAVAATLVTMVNEPGIVSLAGGAFVTVWPAGATDAVTVDGCVVMPGLDGPASTDVDARDVRTEYGGGVSMTVGLASVAVPGALAALDLAQHRYGALAWREVVEPAAEVARDGFALGTAAGYYLPLVRDEAFGWDPETRRALQRADGGWLAAGDRMVVDGLEATVRLIADEGARTLHDGALAAVVAADMAARGGLVTRADLAAYRPVVRDALPVRAGRWDLRTNPPPAIGGPVLAAMLTLLGDRPRGAWTEGDVAHLVAVQRRVLDVRRERLDVADDRTSAALELLAQVGWDPTMVASPSTAHISAVDADGTACAITTSYGYGSGATVPGTGLWLNNCLGERELNRSAGIAPGERLASNMAPTVGRRDDGAVLALGSPGADRITTALLQVLASVAHGGAGLQEAVDRPRLHVHHLDGENDADGGGASVQVEVEADLPLPGLDLPVRRHDPRSMYFGGVGAALRLPDGGLEAAADPRRVGAVVVSAS